ncbi:hypothetical protein LXL04_026308 [Taraxacum kok-saghyz]
MASSSSTGSFNRGARKGVRRTCDCGDLVGMWTAWTARNPGRRFVGCPNYKRAIACTPQLKKWSTQYCTRSRKWSTQYCTRSRSWGSTMEF